MTAKLTDLFTGYPPRRSPCAIEGRAAAPWITQPELFHHERDRHFKLNVTG
jgi:hypothetical protein